MGGSRKAETAGGVSGKKTNSEVAPLPAAFTILVPAPAPLSSHYW